MHVLITGAAGFLGRALAQRLVRQVATTGRPLAYLLSGAPFTRRAARLRRTIEDRIVCARHATVRGMADAVIAAAGLPAARRARFKGR